MVTEKDLVLALSKLINHDMVEDLRSGLPHCVELEEAISIVDQWVDQNSTRA